MLLIEKSQVLSQVVEAGGLIQDDRPNFHLGHQSEFMLQCRMDGRQSAQLPDITFQWQSTGLERFEKGQRLKASVDFINGLSQSGHERIG